MVRLLFSILTAFFLFFDSIPLLEALAPNNAFFHKRNIVSNQSPEREEPSVSDIANQDLSIEEKDDSTGDNQSRMTWKKIIYFCVGSFILLVCIVVLPIYFLTNMSMIFLSLFIIVLLLSTIIFPLLYFFIKWRQKDREVSSNAIISNKIKDVSDQNSEVSDSEDGDSEKGDSEEGHSEGSELEFLGNQMDDFLETWDDNATLKQIMTNIQKEIDGGQSFSDLSVQWIDPLKKEFNKNIQLFSNDDVYIQDNLNSPIDIDSNGVYFDTQFVYRVYQQFHIYKAQKIFHAIYSYAIQYRQYKGENFGNRQINQIDFLMDGLCNIIAGNFEKNLSFSDELLDIWFDVFVLINPKFVYDKNFNRMRGLLLEQELFLSLQNDVFHEDKVIVNHFEELQNRLAEPSIDGNLSEKYKMLSESFLAINSTVLSHEFQAPQSGEFLSGDKECIQWLVNAFFRNEGFQLEKYVSIIFKYFNDSITHMKDFCFESSQSKPSIEIIKLLQSIGIDTENIKDKNQLDRFKKYIDKEENEGNWYKCSALKKIIHDLIKPGLYLLRIKTCSLPSQLNITNSPTDLIGVLLMSLRDNFNLFQRTIDAELDDNGDQKIDKWMQMIFESILDCFFTKERVFSEEEDFKKILYMIKEMVRKVSDDSEKLIGRIQKIEESVDQNIQKSQTIDKKTKDSDEELSRFKGLIITVKKFCESFTLQSHHKKRIKKSDKKAYKLSYHVSQILETFYLILAKNEEDTMENSEKFEEEYEKLINSLLQHVKAVLDIGLGKVQRYIQKSKFPWAKQIQKLIEDEVIAMWAYRKQPYFRIFVRLLLKFSFYFTFLAKKGIDSMTKNGNSKDILLKIIKHIKREDLITINALYLEMMEKDTSSQVIWKNFNAILTRCTDIFDRAGYREVKAMILGVLKIVEKNEGGKANIIVLFSKVLFSENFLESKKFGERLFLFLVQQFKKEDTSKVFESVSKEFIFFIVKDICYKKLQDDFLQDRSTAEKKFEDFIANEKNMKEEIDKRISSLFLSEMMEYSEIKYNDLVKNALEDIKSRKEEFYIRCCKNTLFYPEDDSSVSIDVHLNEAMIENYEKCIAPSKSKSSDLIELSKTITIKLLDPVPVKKQLPYKQDKKSLSGFLPDFIGNITVAHLKKEVGTLLFTKFDEFKDLFMFFLTREYPILGASRSLITKDRFENIKNSSLDLVNLRLSLFKNSKQSKNILDEILKEHWKKKKDDDLMQQLRLILKEELKRKSKINNYVAFQKMLIDKEIINHNKSPNYLTFLFIKQIVELMSEFNLQIDPLSLKDLLIPLEMRFKYDLKASPAVSIRLNVDPKVDLDCTTEGLSINAMTIFSLYNNKKNYKNSISMLKGIYFCCLHNIAQQFFHKERFMGEQDLLINGILSGICLYRPAENNILGRIIWKRIKKNLFEDIELNDIWRGLEYYFPYLKNDQAFKTIKVLSDKYYDFLQDNLDLYDRKDSLREQFNLLAKKSSQRHHSLMDLNEAFSTVQKNYFVEEKQKLLSAA